jgi:hypothetical protein
MTPARQVHNTSVKSFGYDFGGLRKVKQATLPAYKGPIKFYKNQVQVIFSFLSQKESMRLRQVSTVFDGAVEQSFDSHIHAVKESYRVVADKFEYLSKFASSKEVAQMEVAKDVLNEKDMEVLFSIVSPTRPIYSIFATLYEFLT